MAFDKILNYLFLGIYAGGITTFIAVMTKVALDKRRARQQLKSSILAKLGNGIQLAPNDLTTMAKGLSLARVSVTKCLSQLIVETDDQALFEKLRTLAAALEKTEPFEDLPQEVKPSLVRLQELIESSAQKSDVHLLSPLQRSLGAFVELKAEVESSKKVAKWMNLISIIGFIVGLWGFYFAWKSPDVKDMETVVKNVMQSTIDAHYLAPSAASDASSGPRNLTGGSRGQ